MLRQTEYSHQIPTCKQYERKQKSGKVTRQSKGQRSHRNFGENDISLPCDAISDQQWRRTRFENRKMERRRLNSIIIHHLFRSPEFRAMNCAVTWTQRRSSWARALCTRYLPVFGAARTSNCISWQYFAPGSTSQAWPAFHILKWITALIEVCSVSCSWSRWTFQAARY